MLTHATVGFKLSPEMSPETVIRCHEQKAQYEEPVGKTPVAAIWKVA
jgi:hypothetical protein